MSYHKKLQSLLLIAALIASALPSTRANAFDLGDLNPFAQKRLARVTGRIKPPSLRNTLKKMNSGSKQILSGTRDLLFPWTGPQRTRMIPPPPTGTRRVYPASARPDS